MPPIVIHPFTSRKPAWPVAQPSATPSYDISLSQGRLHSETLENISHCDPFVHFSKTGVAGCTAEQMSIKPSYDISLSQGDFILKR